MSPSRRLIIVAALAVLALGCEARPTSTPDTDSEPPRASVIYLVRHAEKILPAAGGDPGDPRLSTAGAARAEHLAHVLAPAAVMSVFSTDYRRTRDTVAPLAAQQGLDVELYDPTELEAFARTLLARPGRHVVCGHSNTTPQLVALLGGEPGPPIDEAREYDRLYVLTMLGGGRVATVQLRFGTPSGRD